MKAKRILALILALLMILPVLVSCKETTNDGGKDKNEVEENKDNPTTTLVREKYGDFNFNGYKFRILSITPGQHYYWMIDGMDGTGWCNEVWYEQDDSEEQIHSVFTRNTLAEELINIDIELLEGGGTYDIPNLVKTLVKAGGDDFDITLGDNTCNLPLSSEGYFYNLYDIKSLDLSNAWWDQEYVKTFTYKKNQLYMVTGDYNIFDDYAAACIFYNKQVLENYNLDDPADLVDAGTWTLDAMMEMAEKATNDLTGDGKMDENDSYGFFDNAYALTHLTEGCDIHMTALNEEGVPEVTVESEEFTNAVQKVFDRVIRSRATLLGEGDHDKDIMKEDRVLFLYEQLGGINQLRDMESDFSLLPLPKKDESQKDYTSVVNGIWCTSLSVPVSSKNPEQTGTIMEVLGGMSTDTVNASLHKVVLGPKLFREKRTVDMMNYVIESKRYDWAKDIPWAYPLYGILTEQTEAQAFTLASSLQRSIKTIKAQLKGFVKRMGNGLK